MAINLIVLVLNASLLNKEVIIIIILFIVLRKVASVVQY